MFSTIDLKSGYWQILLDQPSKHLTTFTIPDRATYQYRVIPFGLKNAPATFQKLLTRVLTGYLGNFVHLHLDDIIIFFQSPEHLGHLRLMYERLHEYGLRCTTEKCRFGVSTILTWARDREELQQAPTAYVPRFAEIAAPITGLLNAKRKFCWTAEAQTTFEQLKQKMSRLLQLHRPDLPKKFTLQTDATASEWLPYFTRWTTDNDLCLMEAPNKIRHTKNTTSTNKHVSQSCGLSRGSELIRRIANLPSERTTRPCSCWIRQKIPMRRSHGATAAGIQIPRRALRREGGPTPQTTLEGPVWRWADRRRGERRPYALPRGYHSEIGTATDVVTLANEVKHAQQKDPGFPWRLANRPSIHYSPKTVN